MPLRALGQNAPRLRKLFSHSSHSPSWFRLTHRLSESPTLLERGTALSRPGPRLPTTPRHTLHARTRMEANGRPIPPPPPPDFPMSSNGNGNGASIGNGNGNGEPSAFDAPPAAPTSESGHQHQASPSPASLPHGGRPIPKQTAAGALLTGGFNTHKVYIGNLPETATLADLEDCFGQLGQCSCSIKRGFGFVVSLLSFFYSPPSTRPLCPWVCSAVTRASTAAPGTWWNTRAR